MANICFLVVLVSSLLLTSFTVGEGYQQHSCAKKRAALRKWITDYKLDSQWLECCSPVAAVKSSLRRKAHFGSVVGSWFLAITTVPSVSKAEKGAFEMDMDYYAKSIFTRNNLNKGLDITAHRSVYKSPRTLNGPFAAKVLDAVINEISETAHISRGDLISSCGECIPAYLSYFQTFAPIVSQNLTDQYYFDMLLLIFYLEAGKSIPKSEERVKLRKRIGDAVLNILLSEDSSSAYHQLPSIILPKPSTIENAAQQMRSLCDGINSVLQIFQDTGMIASFIFDADDFSDVDYAEKSFSDHLAVNFQITLKEPATLLGFLEQARANTFYHPEIVGTTLCSFAATMGYKLSFEDYLVDNFYRPDSKDVQAQDVLLDFTLSFSPPSQHA